MNRNKQLLKISNLMCIWYHDKDMSVNVLRQIKIYLHKHFERPHICSDIEDLTTCLASGLVIKRIIFIISRRDEKEAVAIESLAKQREQFQSFYLLKLEPYASSTLPDIASVRSIAEKAFSTIMYDLEKVGQIRCSEENIMEEVNNITGESPPVCNTFKSITTQNLLCDLNKDSLKFLLLQSLIEALVRKVYDPAAFKQMWNLCCDDYIDYPEEVKKIRKMSEIYQREKAVYTYTQDSCLFRLINRAFRLEDMKRIFSFGCYIADLHQQLEQIGNDQRLNQNEKTRKFYRGKRYSADVIQQLKDNIGHLISINGFFSTSKSYDISTIFCGLEQNNGHCHSVIFEINIDCEMKNLIRPHAHIRHLSANPDEDEVLFFMGFVWKIESMREMESNGEKLSNAWYIILQSCTGYDHQSIKYIEESRRNCTDLNIGNILRELGDHTNAKNAYLRMLKNKNLPDETLGHLYYNLGTLAEERGEDLEALDYFQKAEQLIKTTSIHSKMVLSSAQSLFGHNTVPSRICILNNMGQIYLQEGEYQLSEEHFEIALKEPGFEVEHAHVLNNYGLLKYHCGQIEKACQYMERAVQLARDDACCSKFNQNLCVIRKHLSNTSK